jgi:hypothetical protein
MGVKKDTVTQPSKTEINIGDIPSRRNFIENSEKSVTASPMRHPDGFEEFHFDGLEAE